MYGYLANTPVHGYPDVEGSSDFAGLVNLDIAGVEIGVLGIANDAGTADNYGLYGFSNGIGIHAEGNLLTGRFVGDVEINGQQQVEKTTCTTPRTYSYSVGDGDFHAATGKRFITSAGQVGFYIRHG